MKRQGPNLALGPTPTRLLRKAVQLLPALPPLLFPRSLFPAAPITSMQRLCKGHPAITFSPCTRSFGIVALASSPSHGRVARLHGLFPHLWRRVTGSVCLGGSLEQHMEQCGGCTERVLKAVVIAGLSGLVGLATPPASSTAGSPPRACPPLSL